MKICSYLSTTTPQWMTKEMTRLISRTIGNFLFKWHCTKRNNFSLEWFIRWILFSIAAAIIIIGKWTGMMFSHCIIVIINRVQIRLIIIDDWCIWKDHIILKECSTSRSLLLSRCAFFRWLTGRGENGWSSRDMEICQWIFIYIVIFRRSAMRMFTIHDQLIVDCINTIVWCGLIWRSWIKKFIE